MDFKFSTDCNLARTRKSAKNIGRGSTALGATPTVLIHVTLEIHDTVLYSAHYFT